MCFWIEGSCMSFIEVITNDLLKLTFLLLISFEVFYNDYERHLFFAQNCACIKPVQIPHTHAVKNFKIGLVEVYLFWKTSLYYNIRLLTSILNCCIHQKAAFSSVNLMLNSRSAYWAKTELELLPNSALNLFEMSLQSTRTAPRGGIMCR